LPWCEDEKDEKYESHPLIGIDLGFGDPNAPYQIPMSKNFVKYTQYRKLPLNNDDLRILLSENPKPHVVYSCPLGHLHACAACGVPQEVAICGIDGCREYVGGKNHLLVPGNYIVYHDGYDYAKVWYGDFPAYTYSSYLKW
jgi:hypothetical protein